MNRTANRNLLSPGVLPALVTLTLLAFPPGASAQQTMRAGFTRPGTPSGPPAGGKVVGAIDDPQQGKSAFGGTVYFMVLEKKGAGWDGPIKDLDERAQPSFSAR